MRYLKLIGLGVWLLIIIWFEDTSDWSHERLVLAKRSFAVAMAVLVFCSVIFTMRAFGEGETLEDGHQNKRIDRIELRQDRNFEEHVDMKQRLSVVEQISTQNAAQLDRLIWGVIGLTVATIGQLLLALLKFKLDKDHQVNHAHEVV